MEMYRVTGYVAHKGAGKRDPFIFHIWVRDALEALRYYATMPGVKRNLTPDIVPLSDQETRNLEGRLAKKGILMKRIPGAIYRE